MGLFGSLINAVFGSRTAPDQREQPSELTAVAPDFTGFVSNRPSDNGPDDPTVVTATAPEPGTASVPTQAAVASAHPSPGASELSAVAPEFTGKASNRPQGGASTSQPPFGVSRTAAARPNQP